MKAIAVADKNWGIGREGKLLARLPGDLQYFKEQTLGKVLIMGRETLEGLPGGAPLPGRSTLVLSRNPAYQAPCPVLHAVWECMEYTGKFDTDDVFVAGGGEIYRQFLPWCDSCLITRIDAAFPADRFFENLDAREDFALTWESETQRENGMDYRFTRYERIKKGG
ncbi:MAG: dihydrofolate reductase [Clostridiales Family XIII bacterium]|nr:dihydrofolate reductase [Clostridiales Family XIII bacterium]